MNKTDLIEMMADRAQLTKADAERALNAFQDAITSSLKDGNPVALTNFGTFDVKERAGRTGRNPRTGEPIQIPASKVVSFKAGKALKDAVSE